MEGCRRLQTGAEVCCRMKIAYSELVVGHRKGCKSRFRREVECRVEKTVSTQKAFLRERKRQVEEMAEKCLELSRTRGEGQCQPWSSWGWGSHTGELLSTTAPEQPLLELKFKWDCAFPSCCSGIMAVDTATPKGCAPFPLVTGACSLWSVPQQGGTGTGLSVPAWDPGGLGAE